MRDSSSDVVTVGELLARIRTTYVDSFARRLTAAGRAGHTGMIPEVTVCQADGEIACEGTLGLPRRVDACVFAGDEMAGVVHIDSEEMIGFEPLSLIWGDGLDVELNPFTWDACELRFQPPDDGDLAPLAAWFRRWFDEADERARTNRFPGNVVHSLSGPEEDGDAWVVVIDLGSARLKAFEELLDAVAETGRARVAVGRPLSNVT
jgi:hypothetical protein